MTTPKFWTRAMAQGGGWGFVGDMVLGDTTQDRSPMDSLGRSLLGRALAAPPICKELTKGQHRRINRRQGHALWGGIATVRARTLATREPLVCKGCPRSHGIVCPARKPEPLATCRGSRTRPAMTGIRNISGAPMRPRRAGRRALLKWLVVSDAATRPKSSAFRPKRKAR